MMEDLTKYADKYLSPPHFDRGDIITPWQKVEGIEIGQHCQVIGEAMDPSNVGVITKNFVTDIVEVLSVPRWLFERVSP